MIKTSIITAPHSLSLAFGFWRKTDSAWKVDFREWFFNAGWSNKIKLLNLAQPETRLQSAMAHMGLTEKELREGGKWGPNDRVEYPFKKAVHKIGEKLWTA